MKDKKIDALTSLRFFAAASVVYYHCLGRVEPNPNSVWALGVSFFFVLSGFILTHAYENSRGDWIIRFYIGRVARIWPVHIATLAVAVLIACVESPTSSVDVRSLLENIFLVQAWTPTVWSVFSFNSVSWSLSVEVAFYLLFPLIVRARNVEIVFVAALALALLGIGISGRYPPIHTDFGAPNYLNFVLQNPIERLPELILGVVSARWRTRVSFGISRAAATLIEASSIGLIVVFAMISARWDGIWSNIPIPLGIWLRQSGCMPMFAILVIVFSMSSGFVSAALRWRPLVILGEISFCTYMVHLLIIRSIAAAGIEFKPHTFVAMIPAIYAASYLLWRYVERPCRTLIMGAVGQAIIGFRKPLIS